MKKSVLISIFLLGICFASKFNALAANKTDKSKQEIVTNSSSRAYALTKKLSAEEVYDHSGLVFIGSLKSKENIYNESNINKIKYSFIVETSLKGLEEDTKEIELYQWANLSSPLNSIDESRYMFCFYEPSKNTGLTSLVGGVQGLNKL